MIRIEFNRDWSDFNKGGDVRLLTDARWFRLAVYFGEAPGSHMGLWRTNTGSAGLHGWNYRVGTFKRNLTIMAHTRRIS